MYDAYSIEEVVSKLPIEALSITNHAEKDTLFIVSKQGHLLCCSHIISGNQSHYEYMVNRNFADKRTVIEICTVASHNVIICLSDTCLSVYEAFEPYKLLASLNKYKPLTNFAYHIEKKILYILISIKNRVAILKYLDSNLEEVLSINLNDNAQRILWSNSRNLFISMRNECQFAKLSFQQHDGKEIELVDQPKALAQSGQRVNDAPIFMVDLPDKQLVGLCREEKLVDFFDACNGQMAKETKSCRFTDSILVLVYDSPYLVAILPSNMIEVRSFAPSMLVQKIFLPKVLMLSAGWRGTVYAANETQAWKLDTLRTLQNNFNHLKKEKNYELAFQIANAYGSYIDQNQIIELKKSMAANYFAQQKYTKCFEIHLQLNTDVLFIVNIFPHLLPEKYAHLTSRFQNGELELYNTSPGKLPHSKYAVQSLVEYLSMKRNEHYKPINLHYLDYKEQKTVHILSTNDLKRHEASLELIDTVLLKGYLEVNPSMTKSLLRIRNYCIISEAEKDLKKNKLLEELLILYERKKMYRKYLELVQKDSTLSEAVSPNKFQRIARLLMKLRNDQLQLIMEYSIVVLTEDLNLGLQIFTGIDDGESDAKNDDREIPQKNYDRERILQFLKNHFPTAIIPYLEYIINKWGDKRPKFHEELLSQYITLVKRMIGEYVKALPPDSRLHPNGTSFSGDDELANVRQRLKSFLENDTYYTIADAQKMIESDPNLIEERAILYGRMGKHMDALNTYATVLMDFAAAERHCLIYYNEGNQLFDKLFRFYATGSFEAKVDGQKSQGEIKEVNKRNITEALKLLRKHPKQINIVSAFALIPFDTPITRISVALKTIFESINNQLTSGNMMNSLINIAIKRAEIHLHSLKQQRVHINERVECCICGKRIMESAFVQLRDLSISHFYCFKSQQQKKKQKVDEVAIVEAVK